jgi:ABC-type sugar transport system permease subunit
MIIMLVYPTAYTVYVAFTNYGDGHLLTKTQVINQLERQTFRPEDGSEYTWTAYRSESGDFALWLQSGEEDFLALEDEPLIPEDQVTIIEGGLDADGIPSALDGYTRLNRIEVVRYLTQISSIEFGEAPRTATVLSLDSAQQVVQRYVYDPETDTMIDVREDVVYTPVRGTFTAPTGDTLSPGYWVVIGADNFRRLFTSPALRGPFLRVFIWTFLFAFLSVAFAFSIGLFFALVFDHPKLPGKKIIRSLLIIPYALPAFISVNVWRSMFSRHFGIISNALEELIGSSPLWLADPFWARVGIIVVQTWLGFPYMMLICTGALQSLPTDVYEAAKIDGAGPFRQFWNITLPLLLVAVGPLLIASFAFNFNNFTVIDIYAEGGPPIAGAATPAGHTDILITYVFRLAFASGRGADFGYASAITIVIFLILTVITALQFRFTRVWEEVSENV